MTSKIMVAGCKLSRALAVGVGPVLLLAGLTAYLGGLTTSAYTLFGGGRAERADRIGHSTETLATAEPSKRPTRAGGRAGAVPSYPEATQLVFHEKNRASLGVRLCQAQSPFLCGVDCQGCPSCGGCGEPRWEAERPIPWQVFTQGEYVGPSRIAHVPEYRLRVDDLLEFVYRVTRDVIPQPYELAPGDEIRIESLTEEGIDRTLTVLPDGTITLRLLGRVRADGKTLEELQQELEERYLKYHRHPDITVTAIKTNARLEDLRATVDSRFGAGGQGRQARVTPAGRIQLPGVGSVPAQGLTLDELQVELNERYRQVVNGIEVTPALVQRAPRYIYVAGEVRQPDRYTLEAPTTVMQAITLAGGWNIGGNLRQIVVFRRTQDWGLVATKLDLRGPLLGKRPCPADEIWLRDSDIVLVPKTPIQLADDFVNLVFAQGIYQVIPLQGLSFNFKKLSTL